MGGAGPKPVEGSAAGFGADGGGGAFGASGLGRAGAADWTADGGVGDLSDLQLKKGSRHRP